MVKPQDQHEMCSDIEFVGIIGITTLKFPDFYEHNPHFTCASHVQPRLIQTSDLFIPGQDFFTIFKEPFSSGTHIKYIINYIFANTTYLAQSR